ncbi:MAG: ATP-binding protein [Melioribacter sp.]|uniref:ATP-binding protein n=1 Tax=Rosettibacter primus TaxID=3111523 RepID=UPI00247B69EF|nr:ATP-binding protein [Melioribacter sp.]
MSIKTYYKEVESNPEIVPTLDKFVIDIAKKSGMNPEKFNNLSLSFSEALSNSIIHGNKCDTNKKIKIRIDVNDSKMVIRIKDEGKGFDLNSVPDPTKDENILKDSGRGIHIMKSFLDDLYYQFSEEGTETVLVLKLK